MEKFVLTFFLLLMLVQRAFSQISTPEYNNFGTNKIPLVTLVVSPWDNVPACPPEQYLLSLVSVRGSEVASLPVYTTGVQFSTSMDVSSLQPGCYQLVFKGNRELQT